MLKIGSNYVSRIAYRVSRLHFLRNTQYAIRNTNTTNNGRRKALHGFTLIEVMVATAILSLGTILIYRSFFISLESFNYYSNYLHVAPWLDEKIWQVQDSLAHFGNEVQFGTEGDFVNRNKNFHWNLSYGSIDQISEKEGLYRINLSLFWHEGPRKREVSRMAYAIHLEK